MKKLLLFIGISLGMLLIGAISFSIAKAKKWAKHFKMSYFEFAYQLSKALELLEKGEILENIQAQTGIDFEYEDMRKYFLNNDFPFNDVIKHFDFADDDDDPYDETNIIRNNQF